MPEFAYEARNEDGDLIAGLISADSIDHAGCLLADRALFVVRLATERPKKNVRPPDKGHASREQVAWLISQLSVMLETGIRLSDALECLTRQASEPALRSLLETMTTSVLQGKPLSDAMSQFPRSFPPSLVSLIRASELSGTMSQVMQRSSDYLITELRAIKRARSALLYPLFMFILCVAVTIFLLVVILPRFAEIFASRQTTLPLPTRMLMAASDALIHYWYAWLVGAAGIAAALWAAVRTQWGINFRDLALIRSPVIGRVFNSLYQSRSFRTLAVMINAGVPMIDAVGILRDAVPNVYYRSLWLQVADRIKHGESMSDPLLASDIIPEQVAQMVACGDEAGKLGIVCSRLADYIEEQYEQAVKSATQFIEPCMILFMGLFIGLIAASLMLPMFKSSALVAG